MRRLAAALLVVSACGGAAKPPPAVGKLASERPPGSFIEEGEPAEAEAASSDGGVGAEDGDLDGEDRASLVAGEGAAGYGQEAGKSGVLPVAPSQPLWLDDHRTSLTGCRYGDWDSWRENPMACTCVAKDGGVALDCPRMTPHRGIRGCIWTGVTTHFRNGSRCIAGDGIDCVCQGDDERAQWVCHLPYRIHPL